MLSKFRRPGRRSGPAVSSQTYLDKLPIVLSSHVVRCEVDPASSAVTLTDLASGHTWTLDVTHEELSSHVSAMEKDGAYLGVGNPAMGISPGLGLFSVHVQETLATADEGTTRLVISKGRLHTE